ncbi:MAG TPA: MG2 domain-containing protein [Candidatus Acidoferrum sp.]|nr:MG2 domain-containing protein [Candidatus Acidoferrum sp.]
MRTATGRCVFFAFFILVLSAPCVAQGTLAVREAATRFQFLPNETTVDLPIENLTHVKISAHILLELVDPKGLVRAHAEKDEMLSPGVDKLKISFPAFPEKKDKKTEEVLLWYRLRYTVTPNRTNGAPLPAITGILSVGEATPGIFELHAAMPEYVLPGESYSIRVRAIHPTTGRPVAGVSVHASLDTEDDDGDPLVTGTAITDHRGFATLPFSLPKGLEGESIDVTVDGVLGNFTATADEDIHVYDFQSVMLSTDKALYQPGQTAHMRMMYFDEKKKAVEGQKIAIQIYDPDNRLLYRTETITSMFGIASADWQISDAQKLGSYRVEASFPNKEEHRTTGATWIKVSRYDLPQFSVTAKPDRAYYLPDQNAAVSVHADYLFGEPVRKGHVKVVQESGRSWDYKKQKWDIDEGEVYEGETDSEGKFVAHVDLGDEHSDLRDDDRQYRDIHFAAYFTDNSTGRTEQRRFDIRLSRNPIHIYFTPSYLSEAKGLPMEFYVTTDYADGVPAECDLDVNLIIEHSSGTSTSTFEQPLKRVHTNRYGVARVTGLVLPAAPTLNQFHLSFHARDRQGLTGAETETVERSRGVEILVDTDKALYRPEDPIQVNLATNGGDFDAIVCATDAYRVLESKIVHFSHGHATTSFGPKEIFQGEIGIITFAIGTKAGSDADYSGTRAAHTVLFPKNYNLGLTVGFEKTIFRPGEDALGSIKVTGPDSAPIRGALGLVVVDKAVEEREKTDTDFGRGGGFYNFMEYYSSPMSLSGIRRDDLDRLDLSKPLPDGFDLVAQILLRDVWFDMGVFDSRDNDNDLQKLFAAEIEAQITPIKRALDRQYSEKNEYAKSRPELDRILGDANLSLSATRDPWGNPLHARFSVEQDKDKVEFVSAGPDKRFGTDDDFPVLAMSWPYFKPYDAAITRAVQGYHERTGGFIRDAGTLKTELLRQGVNFDSLRDPWGHGYELQFNIYRNMYFTIVRSAGPDGRFNSDAAPSNDDFTISTVEIDSFADARVEIERALARDFDLMHEFPENMDQFLRALQMAGIDWNALSDAWGRPYDVIFSHENRYTDKVFIESYSDYLQHAGQKTNTVPVSEKLAIVTIQSRGKEGKQGAWDSINVARYSRIIGAQTSQDKVQIPIQSPTILSAGKGAISGVAEDPDGKAVVGTNVAAKNDETTVTFETKTNANGVFVLRDLPTGMYTVTFTVPNFKTHVFTNVPVEAGNVTMLTAKLEIGAVAMETTVSAGGMEVLETVNSSVQITSVRPTNPNPQSPNQNLTPRVREYFPETLYWQPELVTDANGRAHLKIPLADSITTWKLSAVASTLNGEIGTAEKEIRAFQPFFVEHDPPRFLTAGDEVSLPVILRNYLNHPLQMNVEMKSENWFTLLSPATLSANVSPREPAREIFRFRATAPTKEAKQQVMARSADVSDAISRKVTVRPNGEEKTETISQVFDDATLFNVKIPETAIPGALESRLKIYPNLAAHVLESIEAILERPYGCGEQTISSTYPSILILKYLKESKQENLPIAWRAHHFVELGYQRLLSYQDDGGGFTYWGKGEADVALTAYAVRFLNEAKEFAGVEEDAIANAAEWLLKQQESDGRWIARDWRGNENALRSAMLTAYVARALAGLPTEGGETKQEKDLAKQIPVAVRHALDFIEPQTKSLDEPYLIAVLALTMLDIGDAARAVAPVERLRKMERQEGDTSYWSLETNTPFYGWGLAGRIETTALVLQAMVRGGGSESAESKKLVSRGLLFLLRNQDRYGIWYSTQATVNVLETMGSLTTHAAGSEVVTGSATTSGPKAEILVDGKQAVSIDLPAAGILVGPTNVDLSNFVAPGEHKIEIRRPGGSWTASAQFVADYYVPWTHPTEENALRQDEKVSDALRLGVKFDKDSAQIGEMIHCTVETERIGFRGYGMLLAEIGLPPGAEVDRASLESAMQGSRWEINQYEVLPDRLIVYLWPRAGGTKFTFAFKLRYGIAALSTPSVLYDYYNPEARALVGPTRFTVQ